MCEELRQLAIAAALPTIALPSRCRVGALFALDGYEVNGNFGWLTAGPILVQGGAIAAVRGVRRRGSNAPVQDVYLRGHAPRKQTFDQIMLRETGQAGLRQSICKTGDQG